MIRISLWSRLHLSPCKVWGKIVLRAPAAGAKIWFVCLFLPAEFAAKRQTASLLTGPTSEFSPRNGDSRYTDSREIWHSRGARGSDLPCKISRQSENRGRNVAPRSKISTFWKRVAPQWRTLWPISTVVRGFYTTNYMHKCFKFNVIRFTDYGVIAEKPRVGHLTRYFPCTL